MNRHNNYLCQWLWDLVKEDMTIEFLKMHGLGNDFIVIDTRNQSLPDHPAFFRALADRKRGVGCDQFALIEAPRDDQSDLYVRLLNSDGSEVGMCGNALRCVVGHFWDKADRRDPGQLVLATQSGYYPARRIDDAQSQVMMGKAATQWQQIPLRAEQDVLQVRLDGLDQLPDGGVMNIGNPHIVFVVPDALNVPLSDWGPRVENHAVFPERTNVEFIQIMAPDHIRMRVWERGAGVTEACGSGACASAWIAHQRGLVQSPVRVEMDGGSLIITIDADGTIHQSGPYATAFAGEFDPATVEISA